MTENTPEYIPGFVPSAADRYYGAAISKLLRENELLVKRIATLELQLADLQTINDEYGKGMGAANGAGYAMMPLAEVIRAMNARIEEMEAFFR